MKNMKKSKIDNDLQKLILEVNSLENKRSKNEYDSEGLSSKIKKVISDIECNRNHSWAVEMFERNKNNLEKIALKYRGNKITYKDMFIKSYQYAKSLKQIGYKKGDKIPICITNMPEFIYMFIATSFIGAEANVVSDWFAEDYLIDIFNKTKSKTIFIDDISYSAIKKSIEKSNIENIVCFSITDSLKNGVNPYQNIDNLFHEFKNNVSKVKDDFDGNVLDSNQFLNIGLNYDRRC